MISDMTREKPTRQEAEDAVRTLISWVGDDPYREGLKETPRRFVRSFEEYFKGYQDDPSIHLACTFEEVADYNDIICLRDIPFESHCEHHISPIIGSVHVAYLPKNRVVGISKLARVVDVFAKRLQVQEKMTSQIAHTVQNHLQPQGTMVMVQAVHHCMTTRGIQKSGSLLVTTSSTGVLSKESELSQKVFSLLRHS